MAIFNCIVDPDLLSVRIVPRRHTFVQAKDDGDEPDFNAATKQSLILAQVLCLLEPNSQPSCRLWSRWDISHEWAQNL